MRDQLVEQVDKTFFDRLNKSFVISSGERDHETMLTDQNFLSLVQDSQSYVVPSLPHFPPRVLVPGEHHVVKDSHSTKKPKQQTRRQGKISLLREKKRKEGTLRQAQGKSMWVFLTRQIDNNEELRTQLEWIESELAAIRTTSDAQKKQLEEI